MRLQNMAACFRNDSWKDDVDLQEDLKRYVKELFKRSEILSFMERDYSQYTWSIRSLDRTLRHFNIFYSNKDVEVDEVREAVAKELQGPGKLFGYRPCRKRFVKCMTWTFHGISCMQLCMTWIHRGWKVVLFSLRRKNLRAISQLKDQTLCTQWMGTINSWVIKTVPILWQSTAVLTQPVGSCCGFVSGWAILIQC